MTDTSKSFARETLDEIRSKLTDANAAACGMIEQSTKRQHFTDVRYVTVRWEPYKPDGARQMKAKGRWQEQVGSGDYFRWANCDRPAFAHDPETIEDLRAQLAAANARADQAEYRIVHIAAGLFPGGFDNNVAAIRDALRDKPAPAQCCMCGKTDLSTVEGDGGPECQLDDGRWTCSHACYDRATEEPAPAVTVGGGLCGCCGERPIAYPSEGECIDCFSANEGGEL